MPVNEATIRELLAVGEDGAGAADDPRLARLLAIAAEMGAAAPGRDAPVREVMARLGDNWSALILTILAAGSFRHATLKRAIAAFAAEDEISQRMLTLRLKGLERDGLVQRRVRHDTNPPRVDYALTPLGEGLAEEFVRLRAWLAAATPEIEAARRAFRSQRPER